MQTKLFSGGRYLVIYTYEKKWAFITTGDPPRCLPRRDSQLQLGGLSLCNMNGMRARKTRAGLNNS